MLLDEFVSAVARALRRVLPTLSIVGLCGTSALAQGPPGPPRTLTLDEALTIAEKASERVAIAAAGVSRADAGRALARGCRVRRCPPAPSSTSSPRCSIPG